MKILAIDPGNIESGWAIVIDKMIREDKDRFIIDASGKDVNEAVMNMIAACGIARDELFVVAIEMVASYGMPVGREVFDTVLWIGRMLQMAKQYHMQVELVYRIEEKSTICHDSKASDANIRRALIDLFADHDLRSGRGTIKNPDFFYGVKADAWSAFAVAYTAAKLEKFIPF